MKVQFYVVTNGETLFDVKGRMEGISDSYLTEHGYHQAERARAALSSVYFHSAYASESERSMHTAKIILEHHNTEVTPMYQLHEMDYGKREGSRMSSHMEEIQQCLEDLDFTVVGGETKANVALRIRRAFMYIVEQANDEDNVLVVTHPVVESILMEELFQFDVEAYRKDCQKTSRTAFPAGGILVCQYEDGMFSLIQEPVNARYFVLPPEEKTVHFYYVRHGQTQFNVQNRMQGWCDSPLTEMGVEQAETARDVLASVDFSKAFVSASLRTRKTAAILLKNRDIPVLVSKGLKEINFGEYEGIIRDSKLQDIEYRHMHNNNWKDLGGETGEEVTTRMKKILRKAVSSSRDGDNVLLVSHGTYYVSMLQNLFDMDIAAFGKERYENGKQLMPNAGIFRFDYVDGEYKIVAYMEAAEDITL